MAHGAPVDPDGASVQWRDLLKDGGGFDIVRIDDPGHLTMQGSTNASLSNFFNSAHSTWGDVGGFDFVASVCTVRSWLSRRPPGRRVAAREGIHAVLSHHAAQPGR